MKIGFMTWSTPKLTLEENLKFAQEIGVDGIEARTSGYVLPDVGEHKGQGHGIEVYLDQTGRKEKRTKIEDSGIELCCIATSIRYANPETNADETDHTRKTIELAHDMGCTRIRVFGGNLPEGVTREQATDLLVTSLSSVADQAKDAGVYVCLETHDAWSDPRFVAPVLQQVDHPAIKANWDFAHPRRAAGMSVEESFEIVKPWIWHSHVHDMIYEDGKPAGRTWIGEGEIDHCRAMELMMTLGYPVYMSGEWINRDPDYRTHLPREMNTLKSYREKLLAAK